MHFVTETELRYRYRQQVFTEYRLSSNDRLTPEARQFLADRQILLIKPGTEVLEDSSSMDTQAISADYTELLLKNCQLDLLAAARLAYDCDYQLCETLFELADSIVDKQNNVEVNPFTESTYQLRMLYILSNKGPLLLALERIVTSLAYLTTQIDEEYRNHLINIRQTCLQIIYQLLGVK
ncbi:hypothetical protein CBF34_08435 [Vagococcus penaei]|uniref:Uncharacterized protein n=1 Tax=Vagococcus penaei TaxID=633807 RepID=A0A1Q2D603_9ENTE|nr:hypothetical protein [Vagococcus penaei]AQP53762.1 hypothetical protein BW732_05595 [Vagococcus penaei]RSU00407.1 hypothetical protein CBF34_08435 [Vagococcus penaei]